MVADRPDGARVYLWCTATACGWHPDGRPKSVLQVYRDVTEKNTLQAETVRAGRLAAIGELAAGVAHEINNPINGIINYADLLLDDDPDGEPEARRDLLRRIVKESERIADIVRSLLSFAREEKGGRGSLHLDHVLAETLILVESQLVKDGIHLTLHYPQDTPPVSAPRQQLQQVFLNLISNARHALNEKYRGAHDDKRIEITVGRVPGPKGGPGVRITFLDRGAGIPAHLIDRIFDPFFSTKSKGEGTGLGLSISHGIVSGLGGRLWFESDEGRYTRALVDLPAWT